MQAHSGLPSRGGPPAAAGLAPLAALFALAVGVTGCSAPEHLVRRLDESHASVCRGLGDVVDGMDRAFGEARVEDRERITRLKLGTSLRLRENQSPVYSIPLALRVPLPALERRANIFLQLDSVSEATGGFDEAATNPDRDRTLSATVLSRITDRVNTGARLVLTWDGGPHTGFRPFLRWERRPPGLRLAAEQQIYYLTDKGFGARTLLEFDRILSDVSFVRLRTVVEGNRETPDMAVEQAVIYRRPYDPWGVGLSAEVGVTFNPYDGDPGTRARGAENDPDQLFAQLRVIGTIFRPWIEYEIAPALYNPWRRRDTFEYGISFVVRIVAERALEGPEDP